MPDHDLHLNHLTGSDPSCISMPRVVQRRYVTKQRVDFVVRINDVQTQSKPCRSKAPYPHHLVVLNCWTVFMVSNGCSTVFTHAAASPLATPFFKPSIAFFHRSPCGSDAGVGGAGAAPPPRVNSAADPGLSSLFRTVDQARKPSCRPVDDTFSRWGCRPLDCPPPNLAVVVGTVVTVSPTC